MADYTVKLHCRFPSMEHSQRQNGAGFDQNSSDNCDDFVDVNHALWNDVENEQQESMEEVDNADASNDRGNQNNGQVEMQNISKRIELEIGPIMALLIVLLTTLLFFYYVGKGSPMIDQSRNITGLRMLEKIISQEFDEWKKIYRQAILEVLDDHHDVLLEQLNEKKEDGYRFPFLPVAVTVVIVCELMGLIGLITRRNEGNRENDQLRTQLDESRKEIVEKNSTVERLQGQILENNATIGQLNEEIAMKNGIMQEMKRSAQELQQEKERIQADFQAFRVEVDQLRKEEEEWVPISEYNQVKNQLEKCREEIVDLDGIVEQFRSRLMKYHDNIGQLKREIVEKNEIIDELKRNASSMQVSADERKASILWIGMSQEMQEYSIQCAIEALEKYDEQEDIAKYIKGKLREKYNEQWLCMVCREHGASITYTKMENMAFKVNKEPTARYLLVKAPVYD